ncbi:MAG: hemerythrin domain-containing protein [Chitinivibrionales bacterium]|nr:hemerythrin domain-containing protein [Chitinivibrionales bacterium]
MKRSSLFSPIGNFSRTTIGFFGGIANKILKSATSLPKRVADGSKIRKKVLIGSGIFGVSALGSLYGIKRATKKKEEESEEIDVDLSAPEDLMREHGVLERLLLIYEECARRLEANITVPSGVIGKTARIARSFVENYHEKLEEQFIFPEFSKENTLTDMVSILENHHEAGRGVTDRILSLSSGRTLPETSYKELSSACTEYVRMYRPHMAREDTELFPALYALLGSEGVKKMGESFEKEEHRLLGEKGFKGVVKEIASIEKQLEIQDLAAVTPAPVPS